MARLPVPGSDNGVWGTLLNEYLEVEHNADGSLKATGTLATKADNSSVVHITGNETIAGTKTFSSAPVVPNGSFSQSAITNLSADLAAKESTANKGTAGGYASLDGASRVPVAQLPVGTTSGTIAAGNDSRITGAEQTTNKGAANGYASLDGTGKVPTAQLPASAGSGLAFRGDWQASTVYSINDIVIFSGTAYVATAAFTSGTSFSLTNWKVLVNEPGRYNVKTFGAKGDGTTDDTEAIKTAISTAVAEGIANGTHYAEVYFPPAVYVIGGAPVVGGATAGRAQIPLPVIPHANQKFLLSLKGTTDGTALYHWQQTTPQRAGSVLRSTHNGGDTVASGSEPSVLGGPTASFGYGTGTNTWSNMLVTIDGLMIEVPTNPNICGFDFEGVAQTNIWNAGVLARKSDSITGAPPIPDPKWAWGLKMPQTNNNDNCNIGHFSVEGLVYGIILTEHVVISSIRAINCYAGVVNWGTSGFPHHNIILYASVENCVRSFVLVGRSKLTIECANIEAGSGAIVYDPSNGATGYIGIGANGATPAGLNTALSSGGTAVVGAANIKITNIEQNIGPVTAPSMPATTVELKNPFWRDAMITIKGGTVSDISIVDPVAGSISMLDTTPGTVLLPSGRSIKLTYTVAPTWQWMLL